MVDTWSCEVSWSASANGVVGEEDGTQGRKAVCKNQRRI